MIEFTAPPASMACFEYGKQIKLDGNSTNGMTGIDDEIFIKVQVYEESDNICYDIMNNYIINYINIEYKNKFECFTFLVGCSLTKFKYVKYFNYSFLEDNTHKESAIYKSFNYVPIEYCVKLMQQVYVRGPLLKDTPYRKIHYEPILKLFTQLQMIGLEFGFAHRDAHLSNIIFNETKQQFVLVDYGRAKFEKDVVTKAFEYLTDKYLNDPTSNLSPIFSGISSINTHDTNNVLRDQSAQQDTTLERYNRLNSVFSGVYGEHGNMLTYIYDISTISLNLLFNNIAKKQEPVADLAKYRVFGYEDRSSLYGWKNKEDKWMHFILDIYTNVQKNLDEQFIYLKWKYQNNPHIAILFDGLHFFLDFLIEIDKQNNDVDHPIVDIKQFENHVQYTINFGMVKEQLLMHEYFQYMQPGLGDFTAKQHKQFTQFAAPVLKVIPVDISPKIATSTLAPAISKLVPVAKLTVGASKTQHRKQPDAKSSLPQTQLNAKQNLTRLSQSPALSQSSVNTTSSLSSGKQIKPPFENTPWQIGGCSLKMCGPMKKNTMLNTKQTRIFKHFLREQYIKAALTNETPCLLNCMRPSIDTKLNTKRATF